MNKAKNNKDSTESPAVNTYVFDEYISTIDFKKRPVSDNWIMQLAKRLRDWAVDEKNEALTLNDFYNAEGIRTNDIHRWSERVPALAIAHEVALRTIGYRREKGGLKRDYDGGMVRSTLPHYLKEAKDLEQWRSDLRASQEVKQEFMAQVEAYVSARDVILKDLPVSDQVPDRPTPEEVAMGINSKMKKNYDREK
jgi:hypothetical protein